MRDTLRTWCLTLTLSRECLDTPGPGWPQRGDGPAGKPTPHSHHLMLHKASRGGRSPNKLFHRSCQTCPRLHHGPRLLHSQATAALSLLCRSVYSCQHPPSLLALETAPKCSITLPRLLHAQSKNSRGILPGCHRHDLRPMCNLLQRCLFSSVGNPQTRDTQTHLIGSKNY